MFPTVLFGATFAIMVLGVSRLGWWFGDMTALFLSASILAGLMQRGRGVSLSVRAEPVPDAVKVGTTMPSPGTAGVGYKAGTLFVRPPVVTAVVASMIGLVAAG